MDAGRKCSNYGDRQHKMQEWACLHAQRKPHTLLATKDTLFFWFCFTFLEDHNPSKTGDLNHVEALQSSKHFFG